MENQVQELQYLHLPAALIHSQLMPQQRRQTLRLVEQNQLRLLYLSPETLLSIPVWSVISQPQVKINGLILDEAHCLVQWGDTFRPAYRRLGAIRSTLIKLKPAGTKIAIAAFTATADPDAAARDDAGATPSRGYADRAAAASARRRRTLRPAAAGG
jgi:ATP-dependent DNA helicase RecQ